MPPPYSETSKVKLYNLIATKSDALEYWPCYPVYLRGEAGTFEEAQKKISNIFNNKQAYAYFTDCENHVKELAADSTKYFQAKTKLKYEDVPELHCSDSEHNFSSTSDDENNLPISTFSKKNKKFSKLYDETQKHVKIDSSAKSSEELHCSDMNIIQHNSSSTSNNENEFLISTSTKKNISFKLSDSSNSSDSANSTQKAKTQKLVEVNSSTQVKPVIESMSNFKQPIENNGHNFSKDILSLHAVIKSLTVEVQTQKEEIKQLCNVIEQTLKVKTDSMTFQKFIEKYNITFKIQNLNEFKDFEKRLTEDKHLLTDFKTLLKHFLEKNVYKTISTILKKIFTRDLALQFTVVRQTKNKYIIKETTFYETLFDLACNDCVDGNNKPITEKEFNKVLGSIFNNAKNWDGQRNMQQLLATHHNNNSEENENEILAVPDNNDKENKNEEID